MSMSDESIDYEALERKLEADPAAVGLGEPCDECSADVPVTYIFGKTIYHPKGRPHGTGN